MDKQTKVSYIPHFSMNKALELVENSKTADEARSNFEKSCSMCYKQAYCTEEYCRLYKKYQQQLTYIDAMNAPKRPVQYVQTREYNISPLNQKVRACLQMMTRIRKHESDYSESDCLCVLTYASLLKKRDFTRLKTMMVKYGHYKRGRQKETPITPIIDKLKEIIKEVF